MWAIDLIKVLNHGDPSREDRANHQAPITCILPMPHNVYTGDEEGRVVRSSFLNLRDGEWYRREQGAPGQVEWRGGEKTKAVWGGTHQGEYGFSKKKMGIL